MKITKDKRLHFICCMLIALPVTILLSVLSNWYTGMLAGLLTAMSSGVAKEYGDSKSPNNKWDWYDILADFLGALAGVSIGLLAVLV